MGKFVKIEDKEEKKQQPGKVSTGKFVPASGSSGFNALSKRIGNFSDSVTNDWNQRKDSYQSSSDFDIYNNDQQRKINSLQTDVGVMRNYLDLHKNDYEDDVYEQAIAGLKYYASYLGGASSDLNKESRYWNQFENEQDYKQVQDYLANPEKYTPKRSALDITNEIKKLKKENNAIQQQMTSEGGYGYTSAEDVLNDISSLPQRYEENNRRLEELNQEYGDVKAAEIADLQAQGYREATLGDILVRGAKQGFWDTKRQVAVYDDRMYGTDTVGKFEEKLNDDKYKFYTKGKGQDYLLGATELAGQQAEHAFNRKTIEYALAGGIAGGVLGNVAGGGLTPEEILTVPGGMAFGAKLGAIVENHKAEAGGAYEEMIKNGVSDETAWALAQGVGGVNSLLEGLQIDEAIKGLEIMSKFDATKGIADQIKNVLVNRALGIGNETLQEVLQEGTTMLGAGLGSRIDKGEWEYDLDDVLSRLGETAVSSAMSFAITGGATDALGIGSKLISHQISEIASAQGSDSTVEIPQYVQHYAELVDGVRQADSEDVYELLVASGIEEDKAFKLAPDLVPTLQKQIDEQRTANVANEVVATAPAASYETRQENTQPVFNTVSEGRSEVRSIPVNVERLSATLESNGRKAMTTALSGTDNIESAREFVAVYNAAKNEQETPSTSNLTEMQKKVAQDSGALDGNIGREFDRVSTEWAEEQFADENGKVDQARADKFISSARAEVLDGISPNSTNYEQSIRSALDDALVSEGTTDALGVAYEGENYESNVSNEKWDDSVRPAGTAFGNLGRRAEIRSRAAAQRRRAEGLRSSLEAKGVERKSGREIGLKDGTDNKTVRLVARENFDRLTRKTVDSLEKRGYTVTVFSGLAEVKREDGKNVMIRGAVEGRHIWLAADHESLTIEQIAKHEMFHDIVRQNKDLVLDIASKLWDHYGEDRIEELTRAYVSVYGWGDFSSEYIMEEILADAYAGIDVFEFLSNYEGATRYTSEVRAQVDETQKRETNQPRAPGETKYSLEAFEDGTRFVNISIDQKQFDGLSEKEASNLARRIINERFANHVVGLDNKMFVNGASAGEFSHPRKNIHGDIRDAKMRVSTELDNLIDAGRNFRTGKDGRDGHVHEGVSHFEYFDAYIKLGKYFFDGVVNLEVNKYGRRFKDYTQIKNVTEDIQDSYGENPKFQFLRNNSTSIVEYNPDVVKLSEEVNSEGKKLTVAQRDYFKDSKIRDEDGNLLVVYHGTDAKFTVFDASKGRSNMDIQGSFFSPWEIDASGYGSDVKAYYLNIKHPASESMGYKALSKFKGQNGAGIKARDYLIRLGYDGVNNGNEEFIAFYPEQIKLISNNTPTENVDVRYSEEAIQQQLEINFGLTGKMKTGVAAAISDLTKSETNSNVRTLAVAFREDLINKGRVDLVGTTVKNTKDMATVAQVFRDPRFETCRYFFVDKQGKIVLHSGVSARITGQSPLTSRNSNTYLAKMFTSAKKLGAEKLYFLHNHPSGNPESSGADRGAIRTIKERAAHYGINNVEGVIINSNKYSVYDEYGENILKLNLGEDKLLSGTGNKDLLVGVVNSPDKLSTLAKRVQLSKDYSALVFLGSKMNVTAVQEISNSIVQDEVAFTEYIENNLENFGAIRVAVVANTFDAAKAATEMVEIGLAVDVIRKYSDGETSSALESGQPSGTYLSKSSGQEYWAEEDGVKFSEETDSTGRKLSVGQVEYFKNSVARDGKGNLLTMFHGTNKFGFTVFKGWQYFTADKQYAERYSRGTGGLYEVYANITKPFDTRIKECREIYEKEFYGNYSRTGLMESGLPDWTDGYDLVDFLEENDYDYDAIYLDEGGDQTDNGVTKRGISYVIRNSNQVKNVDNLNPTSDPDIRLSEEPSENILKAKDRELRDTITQLNKMTERAKRAEGQLKRTDKTTVRESDVKKLVKERLSGLQSDTDANDLAKRVTALGNKIVQNDTLDYDELKTEAVGIAKDMVEGAKELINGDELSAMKKLRAYLRGQKFYFDNTAEWRKNAAGYKANDTKGKGEIQDYKYFHSHNLGRFTLTKDSSAMQVDKAWNELQEMFGKEWFPDDITTVPDMVLHISDLLDNAEPIFENPYDYDMAEVVEYEADALLDSLIGEQIRQTAPTFADKAAQDLARTKYQANEKLKETVAKKNEQLEKQKLEAQWHEAEALNRVRKSRDAQLKALKDHYAQTAKEKAQRKLDSAERTRLLKIARRLANKKLPQVSRALINEYIGDIDLVAKSLTGKSVEKLTDLRDWYDEQKEVNPDFIPDARIEKAIARLSKIQIADMTQEDVRQLTEILLNIENEIRTSQKLIADEDRRYTYMMGEETIRNIERTEGLKGLAYKADSFFVGNVLSPVRAIRRMTGYADNDPLYKLTLKLQDGQRNMLDFQRRANAMFKTWTDDKDFLEDITGKHADEISITGISKNGPTTVQITPAMRMSLYLHSLNPQNLRHIVGGGITVPDMKLYKKGDIAEAYARGTTIRLTPSEVKRITAEMSAKERAFARAASSYFNGMSQEEINQVSEQLKGYSLAGVENYFPINTDSNFLAKEFESLKQDGTIEGMGFLKERVNAAGPILLRDMNAVLDQSVSMTSKYVGLAIPVRNFNKVWNVTSGVWDEDGKRHADNSVQKAIQSKWGKNGYDYVANMMTDLQGGAAAKREAWGKLMQKIRSNYAGAVLELNLSVAMKQAASYPTAAAVLGGKALIKAFSDNKKADLDLIAKYTPLLWYRSLGYSTQELGDIASMNKSLPKALNWIQFADVATTTKLWKASEFYVRDNYKALRVGSDEYYKQVAQVYNRVIEETQPNYLPMQRPGILRTQDTLLSSLMMFKTQPFQNFNILVDAYGNLKAKKAADTLAHTTESSDALKQAQKEFKLAVASQVAQMATFAAMTAAWAFLRGKTDDYEEDEEVTLTSFMKKILKDMGVGAAGMIPFGTEIWEAFDSIVLGNTYYGFDSVTASAIGDAVSSINTTVKKISDMVENGFDLNEGRLLLKNVVEDASKLVGVPIENIHKFCDAMYYQIVYRITGSKVKAEFAQLKANNSPKGDAKKYKSLLYQAYKGDEKAYKDLYSKLPAVDELTDEKLKSYFENRMKEDQGVSSVKDLDQRFMTPEQQRVYDDRLDTLEQNSVWNKATDEQRESALDTLYNMTVLNSAGEKAVEKLNGTRLSDTEYILYMTALGMVDKPNSSGNLGTYDQSEVEAAIRKLNFSSTKKDDLWYKVQGYKKDAPKW